jgi:hypothetical protein
MNDPSAVPVAVKGFTWGAAAGWSTFLAVVAGIAMAMRNAGPFMTKMVELILNRGDKIRGEKREEELSLTDRVEAIEKRASTAERRLGFVMSACTTLIEALEGLDKDHAGLKTARAQLRMAVAANTEVDPFEDLLNQLGGLPSIPGKP